MGTTRALLGSAVLLLCVYAIRAEAQSPVTLQGINALNAGGFHACAVNVSGQVLCWGSINGRVVADLVPGLSSVQAVSGGANHACALTTGGGVKCWGSNSSGQLGDGTTTFRSTPVDVQGLGSGVTQIAAGENHTCAIVTGGNVKCWGRNDAGQLGDGTLVQRTSPVDVLALGGGVTSIDAFRQTCAVTSAGGVKCWGTNDSGQLGDGSKTNRTQPVDVVGLTSGIQTVKAGVFHSCAISTGGGLKCWGANILGAIGDGTQVERLTPVDVSGLASDVLDVDIGDRNTIAVNTSGQVLTWGGAPNGDGTFENYPTPTAVATLSAGVAAVSSGFYHRCALLTDGTAKCWGLATSGQVGDNRGNVDRTAAVVFGDGAVADRVTAGREHACARYAGIFKCSGRNGAGRLGDGTLIARSQPTPLTFFAAGAVAELHGGNAHSCALTNAGEVNCWGENTFGQLGNGGFATVTAPNGVASLTGIQSLSTGVNHNCAVTLAGGVKCWGANGSGLTGDGTSGNNRPTPVDAVGLAAGVSKVVAGALQSCALLSTGAVHCWGDNAAGQIGDGTVGGIRNSPTSVPLLTSGVQDIATGDRHVCVVTTGGGVRCWGANSEGQVGDGTSGNNRAQPTDVTGLSTGVASVAVGHSHSCALLTNGAVRCWGRNSFGNLGDGTFTQRLTPVAVTGLTGPAQKLVAGNEHTCALLTSGAVQCWGGNFHGQLGNNQAGHRYLPSGVLVFDAPRRVASLTPAANNASVAPRSDASGRFVVFQSTATNLTGGPDGNGASDIFRVDLQTGATERMSVDDAGGEIGGGSIEPAVSADGGLVVFVAPDVAVNKLYGETKSARERRQKAGTFGVFLRNVLTGQTARTLRVGTALAGGTGTKPQISADGRKVVFSGESVGAEGVEGQANVFLVGLTGAGGERVPQPRECVSCQARSAMGMPTENSDGGSAEAVVSADGTWVAYTTQAKNQVGGAPSPCPGPTTEVNLRNMLTGVVRRVSPPAGLPPLNCGVVGSGKPSIDWSGLNLAFQSDQALTPGALAGREHVFAQFGQSGIARLSEQTNGVEGNADSTQPAISGDGSTVAFVSAASNLDASFVDGNGRADNHVRRQGRSTERLSKSVLGAEANEDSNRPALNYNGTLLVFDSAADNLVNGDANAVGDVFQRVIPAASDLVFATGFD